VTKIKKKSEKNCCVCGNLSEKKPESQRKTVKTNTNLKKN
jgi:hypothetical protein